MVRISQPMMLLGSMCCFTNFGSEKLVLGSMCYIVQTCSSRCYFQGVCDVFFYMMAAEADFMYYAMYFKKKKIGSRSYFQVVCDVRQIVAAEIDVWSYATFFKFWPQKLILGSMRCFSNLGGRS